MDSFSDSAAMQVALFCRLNRNRKINIPIRCSELGILMFLSLHSPPTSPAAISGFFGISRPSATSALKKLEKEGYISRKPCLTDRRSCVILLTKQGKQLVCEARSEYNRAINAVRSDMGDAAFSEFIALISQANSVLKNLDL